MKASHHAHQLRTPESPFSPPATPFAGARRFARALRTGIAALFLGALTLAAVFGFSAQTQAAPAKIAAGAVHSLYVTSEGKLYAMGDNSDGQLGDGTTTDRATPVFIADNVAFVAAGTWNSFYITTDKKLYAMGSNFDGQIGNGSYRQTTPFFIADNVVSVAAGEFHSLYVTADGKLYAMGNNEYGQLGDGTTTEQTTPVHIADKVASVAAGSYHSLYVTTDGELYAMGNNECGQLGDGTTTDWATPVFIANNITSAVAGGNHSFYVTDDNKLYAMGWNLYGQLGDGSTTDRTTPVFIKDNVASVAAGYYHSLYATTDNKLYATGYNEYGQLGDGTSVDRKTPVHVADNVASIAAGGRHSLYLTTTDKLYAMGWSRDGQFGDGTALDKTKPIHIVDNVASAAAGMDHSLYVTTDNKLYAMGGNYYGQLGAEISLNRLTPVHVTDNVPPAKIAASSFYSFYITADGKLYAMGENFAGQLGNGTTTDQKTPVLIASDVASVSTGGNHSLYVTADNKLYAMGWNGYGQLGDGTTTDRTTPVLIKDNVAFAVAGAAHSLYITTNGDLYAMGYNPEGQLGDGTTTDRTTPVFIKGNVVSAAAGSSHSLYVTSDGELYAMGANWAGQLGDGTTTDRTTPVFIKGNVISIAAGFSHSFYVTTEGELYAAGYNSRGQLGDGTKTNQATPVYIAGNVASVAAGNEHSLYVTTDNKLYAMGENFYGQLGDGITAQLKPPVFIAKLSPLPDITVQPQPQTVNIGGTATFTVAAIGEAPLNYQWYFNNTALAGETTATLTLANVTAANAGEYTVKVSNGTGEITSAVATLTVNTPTPTPTPPSIGTQPQSQAIDAGGTATFTVAATDTAPLSYQWYFNNTALAGETSATLTLANVTAANAGEYTVKVSNGTGEITSAVATLTVNAPTPPPTPPSIGIQPQSQTINAGEVATFTVVATGTVPLGYQWYFNNTALAGETSAILTLANVTAANAGEYTVKVSNGTGEITSAAAVLIVNTFPSITTQPQSQTIEAGGTATFTVAAAGAEPLSYQWYFNNTALPGETTATLVLVNVTAENAGAYTVKVSNDIGEITSAAAVLTVKLPPIPPQTITAAPDTGEPVPDVRKKGLLATAFDLINGVVDSGDGIPVAQGSTVNYAVPENADYTYQWKKNGVEIADATKNSYSAPNAAPADRYTVVISSPGFAPTEYDAPAVKIISPPEIVLPPADVILDEGDTHTLRVSAKGPGQLYYQWYHDGVPIPDAVLETYTITAATAADAGVYEARVANYSGVSVHSEARVEVSAAVQQTLALAEINGNEAELVFYADGSFIAFSDAGVHSGKYTYTLLVSGELARARLVGDDGEFYITLLLNLATGVYTIESLEEETAAAPVAEGGIFDIVHELLSTN
jgi:alpha-tubulin suppressor-like RCC1 family protein/nitrogen fixation protein FixH